LKYWIIVNHRKYLVNLNVYKTTNAKKMVEKAINSNNGEIFASVCRLLIDGLVILANTSSDEDHKERFVQLVVKHMRDELEITQKQ